MAVRVRFAPSPTGHVHIGNIRVAIFNWLFARHEGGTFLLRVEDTDRERSTPEAVARLLEIMRWLGLDYDEDPVYQSARQSAHLAAAEELLRRGQAYREDKGGQGKGECVMFRMPDEAMTFHDTIKGELRKESKDLPDFVIVRSNGTPVFHLANVVDDIAMGVTHVIRGDDHIENTYRHVALYRALNANVPAYAHLPMIVNGQGKPYSKRDGDAYVGDFRDKGVHPAALFNTLSLLGWSPGDDREKMTRAEAVSLFSLDRIKSGPAQMDMKKLTHLNGLYIGELSLAAFMSDIKGFLPDPAWALDDDFFSKVCVLMQSRTRLYTDVRDWAYFFCEDFEYEEKAVRKQLMKEGTRAALSDLRGRLQDSEFGEDAIEQVIHETEREMAIPEGKLNLPIRVAVTGISRGAGIYETLALLGRERSLQRLDRAVADLCGGDA